MKEPEDKPAPKKNWKDNTDWRGLVVTVLVTAAILGMIIIGSYNSSSKSDSTSDSGDYHGYGWERGY